MAVEMLWLLTTASCLLGPTSGSIVALIPHELHPGWPLKIAATISQETVTPVYVQAKLSPFSNSDIAIGIASGTLNADYRTKIFEMQIPEVIEPGTYRVIVETTGGIIFSRRIRVSINSNTSLILVQTDKNIYKPGQTVHFRVLNVDTSLTPINRPLTVTFINPKGSKIEQFPNVDSITGVIEESFELSRYAVLGQWKIQVTDHFGLAHHTMFTVKEFVLPKFSVDVKVDPGYVVKSANGGNQGTNIIVNAVYTYGKNVQGNCLLTLSTVRDGDIATLTKQLSATKETRFVEFDWNAITSHGNHYPYEVKVTAEVTDETGRTEMAKSTFMVYEYNVKLDILDSSTKLFRNGLPADLFIRVSDLSGNPIQDAEVEIVIYLAGENMLTTVQPEAGQIDIKYQYTPHKLISQRDIGFVRATLTSYKDIYDTMEIKLYRSNAPISIMIKPKLDQLASVGETVEYDVIKSESISNPLHYVVVSQGTIVEVGTSTTDVISILFTRDMCPHGKLVVYTIIVNEELSEAIADGINLSPGHCFNKEVTVNFDAEESRTGSDVNMHIQVDNTDGSNAMPGQHDVYYLAVDKSILELQGNTDLNEAKVTKSFSGIELGDIRYTKSVPHSAGDFFQLVGLEYINDGMSIESSYDDLRFKEEVMFSAAVPMAAADSNLEDDTGKVLDPPSTMPVETVRKDFPDTWLWDSVTTGLNGKASKLVHLPDTITSWVVSAFAINPQGLAVSGQPFELIAFNHFFLSMNLPYSLKRGEKFVLRITVFNYKDRQFQAMVKLQLNQSQFDVTDRQQNQGWAEKSVQMRPNLASSVEFTISATTLGLIDLIVHAEDDLKQQSDDVHRTLLVQPEGVERSRAITKALIIDSDSPLSETFHIDWPDEKIVPDSRRLSIKITGDLFGQALSKLNNLLSIPFGCGEQNMISTVPNIFGLRYIKDTRQLGLDAMKKKMLLYMKQGYQQQLDSYLHGDGSYSAWGDRDGKTPGSTWLTAFVVKSFSHASKYIDVDADILRSGIEYLRRRQESSGEFKELGRVIHQEMTSGTSSGPMLTVYVLISLLESSQVLDPGEYNMEAEANKAISYIKQHVQVDALKNGFHAALTAYALSLIPDKDAEILSFINDLLDFVLDSGAPWLSSKLNGPTERKTFNVISEVTHDLEIAAYTLLTYINLDRLAIGVPIMKWLQSQQNSLGGYRSTQDTVMVLQALSSFATVFTKPSVGSVTVVLPNTQETHEVDISGSRAVLLQTVELPQNVTHVNISMSGIKNSVAIVKVVYVYYTQAGDDDLAIEQPPLSVITRSSRISKDVHELEGCVSSTASVASDSMVVTSLILPSGEESMEDIATLMQKNPTAKRIETDKETIHFYSDTAPGDEICYKATVTRNLEFEVQKPGSAKVYLYYEPEIMMEVPLDLSKSCEGNHCLGSAVTVHLGSVLLTILICTLISLLAWM